MLRSWVTAIATTALLALPATAFAATSAPQAAPVASPVPAVARSLVAAPAARSKTALVAHAVVSPQGTVKKGDATVRPRPVDLSPAPPRESKAAANRAAYAAALERSVAAADATERIEAQLDRHQSAVLRLESERFERNVAREQMVQERWQAAFERSPEIRFRYERGE